MLASDTVVLPGGKGANTAVAAARLGASVALLGAVGSDDHGELLLATLRGAGVDTALVRRVDRPTGVAYITVTPDGENSIVVAPGANAALTLDPAVIEAAKVVVCSLEVPLPVVEEAVAVAARHGVRPILNLSPVASLSSRTLAALDPLVVNEHEAAWLLDGGAPDPVALLALGPRSVVITLGARGAVLAEGADVHAVPAPAVEVVDTTGAGDAFTGALATRLAAGADLRSAVTDAVRTAARSVTRAGAQLEP